MEQHGITRGACIKCRPHLPEEELRAVLLAAMRMFGQTCLRARELGRAHCLKFKEKAKK